MIPDGKNENRPRGAGIGTDMKYIKKLCVLKQLASGFAADGKKVSALLTAESFGGRLTLSLALIGFAPLSSGRYRLLLCDEHGALETFDVPSPAGMTVKTSAPLNIEDGFGCAVCFVGAKVTPVAFGKCGDKTYDVKKLCARLGEEEEPNRSESAAAKTNASATKAAPAKTEPPEPETGETESAQAAPPYDDEIVATENYYEFDDADQENLTIKENKNDAKAAPRQSGEEGERAKIAGKDEDAQSLFRFAGSENLREDERACYYDKVKGDLTKLFDSHPAETELEKSVPLSRWVKVTFARNKYYTVGVISDEKRPKYICYGVPAEKRGEPPEALKGKCSFLPLSVFDLDGKGYWMMFQDAETGQCVKISPK